MLKNCLKVTENLFDTYDIVFVEFNFSFLKETLLLGFIEVWAVNS